MNENNIKHWGNLGKQNSSRPDADRNHSICVIFIQF